MFEDLSVRGTDLRRKYGIRLSTLSLSLSIRLPPLSLSLSLSIPLPPLSLFLSPSPFFSLSSPSSPPLSLFLSSFSPPSLLLSPPSLPLLFLSSCLFLLSLPPLSFIHLPIFSLLHPSSPPSVLSSLSLLFCLHSPPSSLFCTLHLFLLLLLTDCWG